MRKVIMHTAEPVSTRESTDRMVNIIYITYAKSYLEEVAANTTQINHEERTQLLVLLNYFEYFWWHYKILGHISRRT